MISRFAMSGCGNGCVIVLFSSDAHISTAGQIVSSQTIYCDTAYVSTQSLAH